MQPNTDIELERKLTESQDTTRRTDTTDPKDAHLDAQESGEVFEGNSGSWI